MKRTTVTIVTLMALLLSTTVFAQMRGGSRGAGHGCDMKMECRGDHHGMGHGKAGHRGGGEQLLKVADEIGLSEDQVTQLKAISLTFRKQMVDDHATLKKAQFDLQALRRDDGDTDNILQLIDQIGRMKTELKKNQFVHQQQMKDVLTDEQAAKLKELRQERRQGQRSNDCPQNHKRGRGLLDDNDTAFGLWDSDGN